MMSRPSEIRKAIRSLGFKGQISEEAIVAIAAYLERGSEELIRVAIVSFNERNGHRDIQKLPVLHRLTDEHVQDAIRRTDGKS